MDDIADIWDNEQSENQLDAYNRLSRQHTVTIDQHSGPTKQQKSKKASSQTEGETVPLYQHFRKLYNEEMKTRFPSSSSSSSSSSCEDVVEEEEIVDRPKRKRDEAYDIDRRDECVLCGWGNPAHDDIHAEDFNKLTLIIKTNIGVASKVEIAQALHEYFMKKIHPYSKLPILTKQVALEHLEYHTKDASLFIDNTIDDEKELAFCFRNAICRADGSYDTKMIGEYRRSIDTILKLYSMQISKMNYNNGNNVDDMKRAAGYFKLQPKFETGEKKRKRTRDVVL
jgi:hypothetical protein